MNRSKVDKYLDKSVLEVVGFGNTEPGDYQPKPVVLRDGREGMVWVHRETGHGILDPELWESKNYYVEEYRNEYSPIPGEKCAPSDRLNILNDLNEKQFNFFESYLSRECRYLEIGCSCGGILRKVLDFGVDICHAVEPNKQDADFVKKHYKQATVYNTSLEDTNLTPDYYELIVSIEVLEHAKSVRDFLLKCYVLLKDSGVIHLEVPNHNDALLTLYKYTGYDKFYYHKAHIHYFTKESLEKLCSECGIEGEASSFVMYPFFNHVWWCQNQRAQSSAVEALSTPLPTDGKTEAGKAINEFYKRSEMKYEELLNKHTLGTSLMFQGKKQAGCK